MRRLFLIALLSISSVALAQSGEWGSRGIPRRFVACGNDVIAADGRGVTVYDVSADPIRRVSFAETASESLDAALVGSNHLVVATRSSGIEMFSVGDDGSLTDLANYPGDNATLLGANANYVAGYTGTNITVWNPDLTLAAVFPASAPVSALAWHGDTLIAAIPGSAIMMFDMTGAHEPVVIPELAHDLAVDGDMLYVAAGVDGIAQYDISDESSPRLLSRAAAGDKNFTHIAIADHRVVAAETPDAVDVFDTSSGALQLANRTEELARVIAASGSHLFVTGALIDQYGLERETGEPLRVVDISDAAAPRLAAVFSDFAGPVSGVATDGSLAYVVDPPYLRVIDVSTTASPHEIASLAIDDIGDSVRVQGDLAILYGRGPVQLVDVANPYAPRLVTTWNAQGGPPSTAAFSGANFVEGNPYSGFHVVDFNSFATPQQIGGIKGHYFDIASDGGSIVYVSVQQSALGVVDAGDVHNPALVDNFVIGPVEAAIANETTNHPKLLVVQTQSGIRIYSLGNPLAPRQMSSTPTASAGTIAADADAAYVATPGTLQTIDLRDPARPVFSVSSLRPIAPMRIAAANGKVVIADTYSLRIFGPDTAAPAPAPPSRRHVADH